MRSIFANFSLTPRRRDILIITAGLFSSALYLLVAYFSYDRLGFPLDDSWIHQTYARNLAQSSQWAFIPGIPSTGSTSIIWTFLMAPPHVFHLDPRLWAYFMGCLSLIAAALGAARFFDDVSLRISMIIGVSVALEWHLVWGSVSGMETAFLSALLIWFWLWYLRQTRMGAPFTKSHGLLLGVWGGILMLVRPEAVLAPVLGAAFALFAHRSRILDLIQWALSGIAGFAIFIIPFMLFNLAANDALFPNTFYAKQTEYAFIWQLAYHKRYFAQVVVSFVGAQILLIPALLVGIWQRIKQRGDALLQLIPLLWVLSHWALFAARLPVNYQHGRYAMPTMPIILLIGLYDMFKLIRLRSQNSLIRVGSSFWVTSVIVLNVSVLLVLGAPAYGRDVNVIESEMVAVAHWVSDNTPPDAIFAVHDIGALGYFAPRPLLDLAGLVSPDVTPFMSDPDQLSAYIIDQNADYLIIFPHWSSAYEEMLDYGYFEPVWSADMHPDYGEPSALGPMTVYSITSASE